MPVAVRSEKVRELVDENAEVEQIATGFTFTEGPIWMSDGSLHFSDMPGDKRRRWHPDDGVTVLLDLSRKCNGMTRDNDGNVIVCEHVTSSVVRETPDGRRDTLAYRWQDRYLNSPNDVIVASDGSIIFTDPTYGRMPGLRHRARAGARLPGRVPHSAGRRPGRPATAGRRLQAAERPLLLARRVAALHQRHRARPHPRLRRRRRPPALERARVRREHRRRRPRQGRPRRRDEARRARQRLRHRARRCLDLRAGRRAPRRDRGARSRSGTSTGAATTGHSSSSRRPRPCTACG